MALVMSRIDLTFIIGGIGPERGSRSGVTVFGFPFRMNWHWVMALDCHSNFGLRGELLGEYWLVMHQPSDTSRISIKLPWEATELRSTHTLLLPGERAPPSASTHSWNASSRLHTPVDCGSKMRGARQGGASDNHQHHLTSRRVL